MSNVKEMNVYQRMHYAASLIHGRLQKLNKNDFQKYKYVSHDDVVGAVRGPLIDARLVVTFSAQDCTLERTTEKNKRGEEVTAVLAQGLLVMRVVNIDNPEDRYEELVPCYALDTSDKAYGKLISYGKKYGLMAMCGLLMATGEDSDQDSIPMPSTDAPKPAPPQTTKADIAREIGRLANGWGTDPADIKAYIAEKYKKASSADMAKPHLEAWRDKLLEKDNLLAKMANHIGEDATLEWLRQRRGILYVDESEIADAAAQAAGEFGQDAPDPRAELYAELCAELQAIGGMPEEINVLLADSGHEGGFATAPAKMVESLRTLIEAQTNALLPYVDKAGGPAKFRTRLKQLNTTALVVDPVQLEG